MAGPALSPRSARAPGLLLLPLLLLLLADVSAETYQYATKYISVPLDHFSFARTDTFQLRYLINDTWWDRAKGPIFLYTGNEGDITLFAQNTGFVWETAPEFGALVVFPEHRYYGQSMPFGDKSLSDAAHAGYLTSQQAMADYVDLIAELRANYSAPQNPVIAFGGSYGGMLAAWMRMKYPNMVAGAIAASAPVLMPAGLTPCDAFFRIVTTDYKKYGACADNIRSSWRALRNISKTDEGRAWLSKQFALRQPLHAATQVDDLIAWLSGAYTDVAMANYPYPADFLGNMPAYPVKEVCRPLQTAVREERPLVKAIYEGISVYFNFTGTAKSLDLNNSDSKLGAEGWGFQSCTEMAMPMCSDGKADMFEKMAWEPTKFSDDCFARYKVRPQFNLVAREFGGKDLRAASNIIFSNGLEDPWSCGGVLRNMSNSVLAILIPEGAHHLDLRAKDPQDPISVRRARAFHRKYIRRWISKHWEGLGHAAPAPRKDTLEDRRSNSLPRDPVDEVGSSEGSVL